jgi:hypothetical protein
MNTYRTLAGKRTSRTDRRSPLTLPSPREERGYSCRFTAAHGRRAGSSSVRGERLVVVRYYASIAANR